MTSYPKISGQYSTFTVSEASGTKIGGFTMSLSPRGMGFSGPLLDEKSLSPLYPDGGEGVVTNS